MNGSIRQHSAGSGQLTVDLGRDSLGMRWRKYLTAVSITSDVYAHSLPGWQRQAADAFAAAMDAGEAPRKVLAG